ncbi:hypothetical protein ABB37_08340 [Leptomonas pyrrhocoris]|uniref:Transmembrane protein n=1 Tax=Leptomonas pyrrhocoris TaxID=157538 RepID=A0A0M9FTM7_LEPPY|nr:hypothetical protein ABB37_08340 [Leptomonas pyrrhocoris]KPA75825.1 hypothetical protein ABB37_08340 [Leptomonas pyrrhocoris]|eukprot:XP_015654264.1 hypothetical protein ABB37_08340 [Leptomonas pyrrhocoris]
MTYGLLVFSTVVLYAPHCLLCAIALAWQPVLIIISLISSFAAFAPLVVSGAVFRLLRLSHVSTDVTAAAVVLPVHFVLLSGIRVLVLHGCLQLQRLGWARGLLLVRSRVPLVALSIAVGAGFGGTSLLVGGGALLAEAWEARLSIPMSAAQMNASAAVLDELFSASASCAQLPRLVQSVFQQTFFTCGQVAWSVMLGQAYAAAYPQALEDPLLENAEVVSCEDERLTVAGKGTREEASTPARHQAEDATRGASQPAPSRPAMAKEEPARLGHDDEGSLPPVESTEKSEGRDVAAQLLAFQQHRRSSPEESRTRNQHEAFAYQGATTGERVPPPPHPSTERAGQREEVEEGDLENPSTTGASTRAPLRGTQGARTSTASKVPSPSSPSSHSPVVSGLVAESVLAQRRPTALLTGLAALGLHFLYVMLPLTALSDASAAGSSGRRGCSAYIPLQCLLTVASVLWGLWIVHCERHPSAYVRLA